MDPEQTFLRVHARLSGMLSQLLTPRIRAALEYLYLSVAVALFCLLVVMHTNFVQQPGCSSELSGIEFAEAQLVQIKIVSSGLWAHNPAEPNIKDFLKHDRLIEKPLDVNDDGFPIMMDNFWSGWISSGVKRSKSISKYWRNDQDPGEPQVDNGADSGIRKDVPTEAAMVGDADGIKIAFSVSARESFKVAIAHLRNKWHTRFATFWKNTKRFTDKAFQLWNIASWNTFLDISKCLQMFRVEHLTSFIVQWLARRSEAFEPTYLYTLEKGYFLLSEGAKAQHNIQTINITISAQNYCFGNRWQQLLINSFVGYDTILMNSLLNTPGRGYLYNFQTKEFYDLNYGHEPSEGPAKFGDFFVTKCGVLIMSLFVFFTTTMSVSFTLRETQSRMLKFTVQLQHHARHQLPTFQLIFVHVLESLVFVPIMIGILFFLFEFYDDQLLAFLVLTLVWLCEVFTMISVRTSISMQFFPRFFLLYFLVFHIYFFSYAYGFSYLAFAATAAFMQHLILYFWNRFEVPALQRYMRNRGQLQQQAGVQITSSTIYTSTLHIARVNVRNTGILNNGIEAGGEHPQTHGHTGTNASGSATDDQQPVMGTSDSMGPFQPSDINPQQTQGAPSSNFNLGSLLLWLLGGASSDGVVSFFSLFRDVRDQGQAFQEPTPAENEQGT